MNTILGILLLILAAIVLNWTLCFIRYIWNIPKANKIANREGLGLYASSGMYFDEETGRPVETKHPTKYAYNVKNYS